jgi:hypothetical protein
MADEKGGPRVPSYPTPPMAPRKKIAQPLPSQFSADTDVSRPGGPKTSARDLALKSRGPIRPLTKPRR